MPGKYERPKAHTPSRFSRFQAWTKHPRLRSLLRVSLSAVILLGGLFVWFSIDGTVAWFVNTKKVSADGIQVEFLGVDPATATITVHYVTGLSGGTLSFEKDGTPVTQENSAFSMPTFSILDAAQRHLLLRFQLSEEIPGLDLAAVTETDYFMDAAHPLLGGDGLGSSQGASYDNAMTSVIKFAAVTPTVTDTAWQLTVPGDSGYVSFVEDPDTNPTVAPGRLTLAEDFGTEVYILLSYDEDLINRIYSDNIGSKVMQSEFGKETFIAYVMDFAFQLVPAEP